MKKLNRIPLKNATKMTSTQMKHIIGGGQSGNSDCDMKPCSDNGDCGFGYCAERSGFPRCNGKYCM